jgi:alanyl-tRNA synthetase
MQTAAEIRKAFLDFFQGKQHLLVPSSSLIPSQEHGGLGTLLLTNAGMVQFKPYFTGEMTPQQPRLTSVQKCFRVSDVDSVGDTSHLTFFEMLGNFSVGDYFKKEAIAWGWEFVTQVMGLKPEQLWATVFRDDDAYAIWRDTGIPAERIRRFDEKDNFWGPAGDEGPCGPCSEIYYDFGGQCQMGKSDADCGPNCECGRFLELWNLVFMQFYQDKQGNRTPLPSPNIDTGLGLERAALILQNKTSIYETDLFTPIVQRVCKLSGNTYGQDGQTDIAIRVVAEHARSATFLIADGVVPSNEGRGYVLRRLIRRAIRFGHKIGLESQESGFLASVAEVVIHQMGGTYPELAEGQEFILRVLQLEEERFGQVLETGEKYIWSRAQIDRHWLSEFRKGGQLRANRWETFSAGWNPTTQLDMDVFRTRFLKVLMDYAASEDWVKAEELVTTVTGAEAFFLHDTYGFPVEVTAEIAREHNLEVDMEGFQHEMEEQQKRSRAAGGFGTGLDAVRVYQELGVAGTRFLGYETTSAPTVVVALLVSGVSSDKADEGQQVEVLLRETPFYAEGGGQAGDTGFIEAPGWFVQVEDTQSPISGLIVHRGMVVRGTAQLGETVKATVDRDRRMDSARNHTATHLLHAVLRQVLGTHVRQQGSLVAPNRLRFDFTHVRPVSPEELQQVEALINDRIRANVTVHKRETTYRQAVAEGALAFFGDRYGDPVRVVEVSSAPSLEGPHNGGQARRAGEVGQASFSFEVCGGTHVDTTGDIGYCHVLSESGVGAGLRRIEAVTGRAAETLVRNQAATLSRLASQLETSPQELDGRVAAILEEMAHLRRQVSVQERASSKQQAQTMLDNVQESEGLKVVSGIANVGSLETLREIGDWLRDKLGNGVVILGAVVNERPTLLVMIAKDLVARGVHAGNIVKDAAKIMGGGGGGRPEMAQAGGRQADKLEEALRAAVEMVTQQTRGA